MNLFELLTFVGCVAVGIELATAYGECMSGKIAYYLIGHVLAAIGIRSISWLLNVRRWFFSDFPPCENGTCKKATDYVPVTSSDMRGVYRCKCGNVYVYDGYVMKRVLPDGNLALTAYRSDGFFIRWVQTGAEVKNVVSGSEKRLTNHQNGKGCNAVSCPH